MSKKVDWLSITVVVVLLAILIVGVWPHPKSALEEAAGLYSPPLTAEQTSARDKADVESSVQSDAQLKADRAAAEVWHGDNVRRTPPLGATADTTGP